MELSKTERLILINQYEIRKALDPKRADDFEEWIEILRCGYSVFYDDLFAGMYDGMSEEAGLFVTSVLDMYRAIEAYIRDNPNDSEVAGHRWARFTGFDGNNETSYLGFTRFLIKTQKKWEEQLPYEKQNDGWNSHAPMRYQYQRMLDVWKSYSNRFKMAHEQVMPVLNAGER